jgi:hypothetical protein
MESVRIKLFVTAVYTLTGKKYLYALGDMAYGEWLIYKNNKPRYYLNVFEDNNKHLIDEGKNQLQSYIEGKLKLIDGALSLNTHIVGIRSSHTDVEWCDLEKLIL